MDRGFSCMTVSREAGTRTPSAGSQNRSANPYTTSRWLCGDSTVEMAQWRWPESNRLRQRLQGAPATLAVTPTGRLRHHLLWPAVFMVLTLWTCQLSSLYERLFGTVNSSRSKRKPPRWDFSLGRLPVSACSRLPGDHSAGQGSRKPRRRIHVPGSLRCLAYRHVSMVSRHRETGQLYFLRILRASRQPSRG